jgi:hypothetical protein
MPLVLPPTGIIRTLPQVYADPKHDARINYLASCRALDQDEDYTIAFCLASQPKLDLLHVYVIIDGEIDARFNFVAYRAGESCKLWDGRVRHPKVWAVCAGPVSRPPSPIKMRGFQGFRYTSDLW